MKKKPRYLNGHGPRTAAEILSSIPADLGLDRHGAGGAVEALEKKSFANASGWTAS